MTDIKKAIEHAGVMAKVQDELIYIAINQTKEYNETLKHISEYVEKHGKPAMFACILLGDELRNNIVLKFLEKEK